MNVMYIKYNSKTCESVIKKGNTIVKTIHSINNVIAPKENNNEKVININKYKNNIYTEKDDEITNYFFRAIHDNYLKQRNK